MKSMPNRTMSEAEAGGVLRGRTGADKGNPTRTATSTSAKLYQGPPCQFGHAGIRYKSTNHCRECNLIASREYKRTHREDDRARTKAYAQRNVERLRAYYQRRDKANRTDPVKRVGYLARRRKYREVKALEDGRTLRMPRTDEQVREAKRIHRKNRQARKRGVGGSGLSQGIRRKLLFLQKGKCAVCSTKLKTGGLQKFHLDHIEPLALGGPHADENVQLLCPTCNVAKGAKPPMEFMQAQGFLL